MCEAVYFYEHASTSLPKNMVSHHRQLQP